MSDAGIEQRAEKYATIKDEDGREYIDSFACAGYTAGAMSERKELGRVILELANLTDGAIASPGVCTCFYGMRNTDLCGWHKSFNKHAELIKELRKEIL